jgi:penicillin-binding protein 1A
VVDTPVTIDGWSPRNANGRNVGETDLRTAFAYSINTVAAQLGNEVGFGTVASMARRFGVTSEVATFPSMVLGSSEVRVIEMTRAFAAISAKGQAVEPYGITKVTSASGEVLYAANELPQGGKLVPDYVVAGMTDLLQAAVQTGTGRAAQIGRPVAGKTGTTTSNKDGWFIGFSSGVTTGVWMGRDDAKAVPGLQGGRAPAQAFAAYMRYAVKDPPGRGIRRDARTARMAAGARRGSDVRRSGRVLLHRRTGQSGRTRAARSVESPFGVDGERGPNAPPAASQDFLEEATGGEIPRVPRRRSSQSQQPPPSRRE